jgi:hypothetical protein
MDERVEVRSADTCLYLQRIVSHSYARAKLLVHAATSKSPCGYSPLIYSTTNLFRNVVGYVLGRCVGCRRLLATCMLHTHI